MARLGHVHVKHDIRGTTATPQRRLLLLLLLFVHSNFLFRRETRTETQESWHQWRRCTSLSSTAPSGPSRRCVCGGGQGQGFTTDESSRSSNICATHLSSHHSSCRRCCRRFLLRPHCTLPCPSVQCPAPFLPTMAPRPLPWPS